MKHFPGIGYATRNTDSYVVRITASKAKLAAGLRPYRTAVVHSIPLIMLSNATYTAYDAVNGAGWSHAISVTLLRHDLGFKGVTITDSLDGTAHARGVATALLAVRAALAGTDMILTTGSEATSRGVYAKLLAAANSGAIPRATLIASYNRILALKSAY
jgi:beta-N-acetylhexosaminidase